MHKRPTTTSPRAAYPKHFVGQALRRAFLCGVDDYSGKSYEHRRQWVVDRIRLLSSLFAIDVCAYAVMHNHYHLTLKLCPDQLTDLSEDDIMDRWCALFKGPLLVQNYRSGEALKPFEREAVSDIVTVWRSRLSSISWFMRCLNQPIARQANLEDTAPASSGSPDSRHKPLNPKKRCSPVWPMSTSTRCELGSRTDQKPLVRLSHHPSARQLPEASDRRYVGPLHCSTSGGRTAASMQSPPLSG